jgi:YYY domain-containing protein
VIAIEVVFLLAFVFLTFVRASDPDITYTEKPMELAFINSIMRSPSMPPDDPWLSGFAISYYYFGYVMVAMLAKLTGVSAGVAFNLGVSIVFALTALGAYGMVYNLLASRRGVPMRNIGWALLGPLYVLLVSNFEGFLEILHARGVFWQKGTSGLLISRFWTWLDIKDLNQAPVEPFKWVPRNYGTGSWWWWRASRVVHDTDFMGGDIEVIDEFPFFSFSLADLHPHVLAMPFAFLAMALALNLFLGGGKGKIQFRRLKLNISTPTFLFGALVFGGLAFLNIWDFPIYVGLFAGVYVLIEAREKGWRWERLGEFLLMAAALGVGGVLLYFPYYVGFSSQAGGILPNLLNATSGGQFWVMFGVLLIPIFSYILYLWGKRENRGNLLKGVLIGFGFVIALWIFSLLLAGVVERILPLMRSMIPRGEDAVTAFLNLRAAPNVRELILEGFRRRIMKNGGWVTLSILIGLVLGLLWPRKPQRLSPEEERKPEPLPSTQPFVLLMVLLGALLAVAPEFVYLKDLFITRMNTIFKFYMQYGVAVLLSNIKRVWVWVYSLVLVLVLAGGLTYTVLVLWEQTSGFTPERGYMLDGTQHGAYLSGDDAAAVAWLNTAPRGVLAEAASPASSYTSFGRISTHSGQIAVLGWSFHENQWRGGMEEVGSREPDLRTIYESRDWQEAKQLIDRYGIRYIYIGPLEHSTYRIDEGKFIRALPIVFQQGGVTVYEVPGSGGN